MAKETRSERFTKTYERLELARRWRTDEGYDAKWRRLIDLYRGKTYFGASTGAAYTGQVSHDRVSVNLAFSTVNVIEPSVAVNHPKITVQANREADQDRRQQHQKADGHLHAKRLGDQIPRNGPGLTHRVVCRLVCPDR